MPNLIARSLAKWRATSRRHREAERLASLPDYLLYDMGLTPGGEAALSRQIRPDAKR